MGSTYAPFRRSTRLDSRRILVYTSPPEDQITSNMYM